MSANTDEPFCEHGYVHADAAHPAAGLEACPTCEADPRRTPTPAGSPLDVLRDHEHQATTGVEGTAYCARCEAVAEVETLVEQWSDRAEAFEHVLTGWESAYPESVFPPLREGELAHAMKLCNSEDKNQSARLYAEWTRHIVKCIRHRVEAEAPRPALARFDRNQQA